MIARIRERIDLALARIENRAEPFLFPPDRFTAAGGNAIGFTMMDPSPVQVDMNLYPNEVRSHAVSMFFLDSANVHVYPDGMVVIYSSTSTIPMPQGYIPYRESMVSLMLIAQIDTPGPHLWEAADVRYVVQILQNQQQVEPTIVLRNLFYTRPEIKVESVEQIQLLYTTLNSSYSRIGPVKTTFDPTLIGIDQNKHRPYVPVFRWNPFWGIGESHQCRGYMGPNGFHVWTGTPSPELDQFGMWVSRIDLRTDHPGWFVNVEEEMHALTLLGRL